MYRNFKLFGHRIVVYNRKVQKVNGVNSNLKDGNHIIMLDFDEATLKQTRIEIIRLQKLYRLGTASIVSTGRPLSYHVYIWNRCTWRQAIQIAASCRYMDLKHLEFSLRRGHFTLRISEKNSRVIKVIEEVVSPYNVTTSFAELESFVIYETANKVTKF